MVVWGRMYGNRDMGGKPGSLYIILDQHLLAQGLEAPGSPADSYPVGSGPCS